MKIQSGQFVAESRQGELLLPFLEYGDVLFLAIFVFRINIQHAYFAILTVS